MDKIVEKKRNNERAKFEVTAKAVVLNGEGKALLFRRAAKDDNFPGKRDLPGGTVEEGETVEEAVKREVLEEAGLEVEVGPVLSVFDFERRSEGEMRFPGKGIRMLARCSGSEEVTLNEENDSFEWLGLDEAIANLEDEGYEQDKRQALIAAKEWLEREESLGGWKRCLADFDNFRKRQEESRDESRRYLKEAILMEILPVADNFEASVAHIPEDQKDGPWVAGIMHIQRQLEAVLADNGLTEIPVAPGDEFDPHIHEAVGRTNDKEDGKVKRVLRKGYRMGDKVIRAARVEA